MLTERIKDIADENTCSLTGSASIVLAALLWSRSSCTSEPSDTIHRTKIPISFTMRILSSSCRFSNRSRAHDPWSWICKTIDISSSHQSSVDTTTAKSTPTIKLSAAVWMLKLMQRPEIKLVSTWYCCKMTKFRVCIVAKVTLMESKTGDNAAAIIHHTPKGICKGCKSYTCWSRQRRCFNFYCIILPNMTHRVMSLGHFEPNSVIRFTCVRKWTENKRATL